MRVLLLLCLAIPALCDNIYSNIIGGVDANIASYRWQMSLRVNNGHSCGACLISGTKAVTAAHCGGGALATYSLLSGTSDRTVTNCGTCALRSLTRFTRHAQYSPGGSYANDIATLGFANVPTNGNTGFIGLPAQNGDSYAGQTTVITGWGRTNIGTSGSLPAILKVGQMSIMTNAACSNVWGNSIIASHICFTSPTVSSCNGDSGGPAVVGSTLVGVTSWGNNDCNPNQPSIYTRITSFRNWIDAN